MRSRQSQQEEPRQRQEATEEVPGQRQKLAGEQSDRRRGGRGGRESISIASSLVFGR